MNVFNVMLTCCTAQEAHFVQDAAQGVHAQLEALHAVYNICRFSKVSWDLVVLACRYT